MVITVFFSSGYCRTGSSKNARRPISRISRLTTAARTGRRTKMSVNERMPGSVRLLGRWRRGDGQGVAAGDGDRRPVLQLELARAHDEIAGLDAAYQGDVAAEGRPRLDEGLDRLMLGLAVGVLAVLLHHEHRIAVERPVDGGFRDGHHVRLRRH